MSRTDPETCPAELPNWCAQRHWSIFWILIVCSLALVTGRTLIVENHRASDDTPFFSANDRSRWCTVRSLGDRSTYEIDFVSETTRQRDPDTIRWDTIDKVRHRGRDGQMHYYSSKPPLLPTLVAWKYKLLNSVTGWRIETDTFLVVRILLVVVNVIPWGIYLWFVARMINSVPVRDWTRYYVLACAGFGTFVSTFAISLNNHLPATFCVMISLYLLSEIWRKKDLHWCYFATAGLLAAFAAANELPALAFFACAGLMCLIRSATKTTLAFLPAAGLVAVAFFATNYAAHDQWRPAYAHRADGKAVSTIEGDFSGSLNKGILPPEIRDAVTDEFELQLGLVEPGKWPGTPKELTRWVVRDPVLTTQFAIVTQDQSTFEILAWNNWYDYPGSYWLSSNDKKSEVDRGQDSFELYLFHMLFGHHGIFSLTPIWLLSLAGMLALMFGAKLGGGFQMRWLGLMGIALSIIVIAFYATRPVIDRNYGGVSCMLRWLMWLTPIWLVSMLPIVDWLAKSKTGKAFCYGLLFVSTLSAFYPLNNPWVHPWLYEIWEMSGLPR